MVMFYSDMVTPQVKSNNLGFKISHELVQFGADYKHGDSRHVISIGFASTGDAARVRTEVSAMLISPRNALQEPLRPCCRFFRE